MTTIGWDFPVRAKTLSKILSRIAQKRARSPASTQCLDILCPPPGTSEVISHFERLSSNEMKMAPICVWIAAGSSCGSSDIGSLQSESDRNLSLPHDRPLSTPHGIFAALAMTVKATGYVLGVVGARERSLTRRSGVQQSFFARVLENAACEIRGLVP